MHTTNMASSKEDVKTDEIHSSDVSSSHFHTEEEEEDRSEEEDEDDEEDDYSSEYSMPSRASSVKDGMSGGFMSDDGRVPFVGIPMRPSDTQHRRHAPAQAFVMPSSVSTSALSFRVLVDVFEEKKDPHTLIVEIAPTDTILRLKEIIEEQEKIPVLRQRIIHAGEQLENSRHVTFDPNASAASVGDGYQIRPGDMCSLVVLPGSETQDAHLVKQRNETTCGPYGLMNSRSHSLTSIKRPSIHVRKKSTVKEILGGSLTPIWAVPRKQGRRLGELIEKPPKEYRKPGQSDSTFASKSESIMMRSSLLSGGLHPYIFDRQKKIPRVKKRLCLPKTALSGSARLSEELGLPQTDSEWRHALRNKFLSSYYALDLKDQEQVLRDLVLHATDMTEEFHPSESVGKGHDTQHDHNGGTDGANSMQNGDSEGGIMMMSGTRVSDDGLEKISLFRERRRPQTSSGRSLRTRPRSTIGATPSIEKSENITKAVSEALSSAMQDRTVNTRSRARAGSKVRMAERERLTNEIFRLRRISSERKEEIKILHDLNAKMRRETRAHLAAMKGQLKQTQHELRKRIEREMLGALLDPDEVRMMIDERTNFQEQIESLEAQLSTLRQLIAKKNTFKGGITNDNRGTGDIREDQNPSSDQENQAKSVAKVDVNMSTSIEGEIARHEEETKRTVSVKMPMSPEVSRQSGDRDCESDKEVDKGIEGNIVSEHGSKTDDADESKVSNDVFDQDKKEFADNENSTKEFDVTRSSSDRNNSHDNDKLADNKNKDDEEDDGYDTDAIATAITKLRTSVDKRLKAPLPMLSDALTKLDNVVLGSEDFHVWARCFTSDKPTVDEHTSRSVRHLLKAAVTLGKCHGLSSKSVRDQSTQKDNSIASSNCLQISLASSDLSLPLPPPHTHNIHT